MGEAFDRTGAVLGTAKADTKRAVFEQLDAQFPTAAELRIFELAEAAKALETRQPGTDPGASVNPTDGDSNGNGS